MRFVYPEHGEVKSERIGYSCPLTGRCPAWACDMLLTDLDGGIKIKKKEDVIKEHPELQDVLQKRMVAIEKQCSVCIHWRLPSEDDYELHVSDGYGFCTRHFANDADDGIEAVGKPQSWGDDSPECFVATGPSFQCVHFLRK